MRPNRLYNSMHDGMGKWFLGGWMIVLLTACGEDVDLFIPRATIAPQEDVAELQEQLRADLADGWTTIMECPCYGGQAFKVHDDLILDIPAGFVDLSVFPCDKGYFTLQAEVLDSRGEILTGGIPTLSEGQLLESRVECNIRILDGDNPVSLAEGKKIRLLIDDPDPRERMELFYGHGDEWIQADGAPNVWENVQSADWNILTHTGGYEAGFGYECFSDSLGWIGVEVFFQIPPAQLSTVCIDLPELYTNTNTAVYMVFRDYKSLLRMNGEAEMMQFCEPYGAAPTGFRVTFIVLAKFGDEDYRFAAQESILRPNHVEYIEPLKTPYAEIRDYLSGL